MDEYVAMPRSLLSEQFLNEKWVRENIKGHGGITYYKKEGDCIVFGFDCAHAWDMDNPKTIIPEYALGLTIDLEKEIEEML